MNKTIELSTVAANEKEIVSLKNIFGAFFLITLLSSFMALVTFSMIFSVHGPVPAPAFIIAVGFVGVAGFSLFRLVKTIPFRKMKNMGNHKKEKHESPLIIV